MNYKFANWQESRQIIPSFSVSNGEATKYFPVEFYKGEGKYVYYVNREYPNLFIATVSNVITKAEEDDFIKRTKVFFENIKDGTYLVNLEKVLTSNVNFGIPIWKKLKGMEQGEFLTKDDWSFQPKSISTDCQLVRNYSKQFVFHIYSGSANSQAYLLYAQGISRHHCAKFINEPEQTEFGKKVVLSLVANRFNIDIENNVHLGTGFSIPTFYENTIPDNLLEKFKQTIAGNDLCSLILNKLNKPENEEFINFSAFIYASNEDLKDIEYPIVIVDDFNLFDKNQNEKIMAFSPKEVYVKLDKPNPFIKTDLENLSPDITFIFDDEITEEALNKKLESIVK